MKLNTQKISNALLEHGFNQSSLAEKIGVSREAVSQWLRGEAVPRGNKLLKISKILQLTYDDMFFDNTAPTAEFRKKGNFKIDETKELKAKAQANLIELLSHHIPYESISEFSTFVEPRLDYKYIQEAAGLVRSKLNINSHGQILWSSIFELFRDSRIIFVPVLWGDKHYKNGIHFNIPATTTHWIFINLDTNALDFAFMVGHELGHAKTPSLQKEQAEEFADNFAGALLYPWNYAEAFYEKNMLCSGAELINQIKQEAMAFVISPITVYKEVNKYALHNKLSTFDLEKTIYAAAATMAKDWKPISYYLFGDEKTVTVKKYIDETSSTFHSCFFECLRGFLQSDAVSGRNETLKFIAGVMDVTLSDAEEIILELLGGNN